MTGCLAGLPWALCTGSNMVASKLCKQTNLAALHRQLRHSTTLQRIFNLAAFNVLQVVSVKSQDEMGLRSSGPLGIRQRSANIHSQQQP